MPSCPTMMRIASGMSEAAWAASSAGSVLSIEYDTSIPILDTVCDKSDEGATVGRPERI